MSWTRRVKHPSEVLKKGDDVEAIITSIDQENRRISLSIKEFQPNDWQTFREKHQPGRRRRGSRDPGRRLRRLRADRGPRRGPDARLRDARCRAARSPRSTSSEGDPVRARILRIEDADMKVGLSSVDVEGQPQPAPAPLPPSAESRARRGVRGEAVASPSLRRPEPPRRRPGPGRRTKKRRARRRTRGRAEEESTEAGGRVAFGRRFQARRLR